MLAIAVNMLLGYQHFASTHSLFQQPQQTITGTVTDSNGTLLGVTILIKGKASGTLTDENGRFSINVNPSDVLVFSYLGYKTVEITIANQTVINVKLEEDTTTLKESSKRRILQRKGQRAYRKYFANNS